ncbi:MAG: O-antigen ligase family protein [Candidatus Shapirobacteria bacterium]|nr:O-antigen ligase family protein [Candidatus Shapirobacteria bacterium]
MFKRWKSPEVNSLSLAIIGLLIFLPIYPKFPLFNVPGTYVAIRVEDFIIAFVILLWLVQQAKTGFSSLKDRVGKMILLYWGIGFISLLSAIFLTKNIVPHIAVLHFFRRIEYMSLFFVALASVRSVKNIKTYCGILLLATLGVIVAGLGQKFLNWPVVSTMNEEFSKGLILRLSEWARINSTFAGHYDLAAYLVLILAITASFFFIIKNKMAKVATLLIGFFSLYILILTASRVSFAVYLVAIFFVLLFTKKYWWIGPVMAISLIMMLLSEISGSGGRRVIPTPTPTLVATASAEIEDWMPTTELAVQYSNGIRFNVEWPRAIRAFLKNPFLGTGFSSVTLATDNDYLRLLAETGFLGFASFFLIFLEIIRRVIVFLRKNKDKVSRALVIGFTGGLIGFLGNAVFIDVFESSKVAFIFWIIMGSLVGLMKVSAKDDKINEKNV